MILLIDNYDSFTYNLYQYIGIFSTDIRVVRNDKITLNQIKKMNPDKIVLSPGPKSPYEAGICIEVVKQCYQEVPILGVCLGHQCIGAAFGGIICHAKSILHGKQSTIFHDAGSIFKGINSPLKIARYHSLAVSEKQFPKQLQILAKTEDGEIMAMKHKQYPVVGLQFHPESIYTEHGKRLIENFVNNQI